MTTLSSSPPSKQLVTDNRAGHYSLIFLNVVYFLEGLNSFLSSPSFLSLSFSHPSTLIYLLLFIHPYPTLPFLQRYHRLPSITMSTTMYPVYYPPAQQGMYMYQPMHPPTNDMGMYFVYPPMPAPAPCPERRPDREYERATNKNAQGMFLPQACVFVGK